MNVNFELPKDTLLVKRVELKEAIKEILEELQVEKEQGEVMTIKETAEYLKVSVPTVRNMITNKDIPFFQRGQVIRINRRQVAEWMQTNSKQ